MSCYLQWAVVLAMYHSLITGEKENIAFVQFHEYTIEEKCSLPDFLPLTVTADSHLYSLNLVTSGSDADNIPLYEFTDTESYTYSRVHTHNTQTRLYQDVELLGVMAVKCAASNQLEVSGSFVTPAGERVFLERDFRYRRSAETAEKRNVYRLVQEDRSSASHIHDYILPPPSQIGEQHNIRSRRERETENIYIDVLVLIENRLYLKWYNKSSQSDEGLRREETLTKMRQYYAFVLKAVDVRYKRYSARMNIRLIGYLIESGGEMEWVREVRLNESESDRDLFRLNGDRLQDSALKLKQTNTNLPPHDHLMIFTGYDIYYSVNGSRGNLLGIAFFAVVCNRPTLSISVTEDEGSLLTVIETATHELAHGLGVNHDGDGNSCRSEDLFIMSDGVGYQRTDANMFNSYIFSPCSVTELTDYITTQLDSTNQSRACMNQMITATNVTDLGNTLAGQVYTADNQCKMMHGAESSLCSDVYAGNFTWICHRMLCRISQDRCAGSFAVDGTFCGQDKWCLSGKCVNTSDISECDSCASYPTISSVTPPSTSQSHQSPLTTSLSSSSAAASPPHTSSSSVLPSSLTSLTSLSFVPLSFPASTVQSSTTTPATNTHSPSTPDTSSPPPSTTISSTSTTILSTSTSPTSTTMSTSTTISSTSTSATSTTISSTSTVSTAPPTKTSSSSSTPHRVSTGPTSVTKPGVTVSSGFSTSTKDTVTAGSVDKSSTTSMVTKNDSQVKTPGPVIGEVGGLDSSAIGGIVGGSVGGIVLVVSIVIVVKVFCIRNSKQPAPTQNGYNLDYGTPSADGGTTTNVVNQTNRMNTTAEHAVHKTQQSPV